MSKFDASIPVLTEVFLDQPAPPAEASPAPSADGAPASNAAVTAAPALATSVSASPADAAPPATAYAGSDDERAAPSAPDTLDWERLERQVSQRVLQQLNARVDFVLEQRIRDSMEEILIHALRGLTDEIRAGLHDTLGKIVTRAVQQEITHLQASAPRQDDKR